MFQQHFSVSGQFQILVKQIHVPLDTPVLIHLLQLMRTITDAQVLLTRFHYLKTIGCQIKRYPFKRLKWSKII